MKRRDNLPVMSQPEQLPVQKLGEYDELGTVKQWLTTQKKKSNKKFRRQLPYLIGYSSVLLLLLWSFCVSFNQSYNSIQKLRKQSEIASQQCLQKYETTECSIKVQTPECKALIDCIKSRPKEASMLKVIGQSLSLTIVSLNRDIFGFMVLVILIILFRLLHLNSKKGKKK